MVAVVAPPGGSSSPEAARAAVDAVASDLPDRPAGSGTPGAAAQLGALPLLSATVDAAGLARLTADPTVTAVVVDRPHRLESTPDLNQIGAPAAWAIGGSMGAGEAVAVVDSGVDRTHSYLAGKVVDEACFTSASVPDAGGASQPNCPDGGTDMATTATGVGAARPCLATDCEHGTHVAGIAVGGAGGDLSGVAPGASLVAVNVFSTYVATPETGYAACGGILGTPARWRGTPTCWPPSTTSGPSPPPSTSLRSTSAWATATRCRAPATRPSPTTWWPWTSSPRPAWPPSWPPATTASPGGKSGLSSPACVSRAVAVGATSATSDIVASYSNSSPQLALLAPGSAITSSVPGGTPGASSCPVPFEADWCKSMSGTSMATPHVAGALAVLRAARPDLGGPAVGAAKVAAEVGQLEATGRRVTDLANGLVTPRLQLDAAVADPTPTPAGSTLPAAFPDAIGHDLDGRIEVFRTGPDGRVENAWQLAPNSAWSGWGPLGGELAGPPVATINTDGRLELFGVDTSGALVHSWQVVPGAAWSGFVALGTGAQAGRFSVVANLDGRLELFAAGTDGVLRHRWQLSAGSGWTDWYALGSLGGVQGVASRRQPDGRVLVAAVDGGGRVRVASQAYPGGGWGGWVTVGAGVSGTPALGASADGRLELFAATSDGTLVHTWQVGPGDAFAAGLAALGPGFDASGISVGTDADGRLEVFGSSASGAVVHVWQAPTPTGWSGVAGLGAAPPPVAVTADLDGRLELFSPSGRSHRWQVALNGDWSPWVGLP